MKHKSITLDCPNCQLPPTEEVLRRFFCGVERFRCSRCKCKFDGPSKLEQLEQTLIPLLESGVDKKAVFEALVAACNYIRQGTYSEIDELLDRMYTQRKTQGITE